MVLPVRLEVAVEHADDKLLHFGRRERDFERALAREQGVERGHGKEQRLAPSHQVLDGGVPALLVGARSVLGDDH